MIVGADGKPMVTEGRWIRITETKAPDGRKMWGVDFSNIQDSRRCNPRDCTASKSKGTGS